jgi:hypothetical protein
MIYLACLRSISQFKILMVMQITCRKYSRDCGTDDDPCRHQSLLLVSFLDEHLHSYGISDCKYSCHVKCLTKVCRLCAHVKASENPAYIVDICPELGLSAQAYRCAECKAHITFSKYCHTCLFLKRNELYFILLLHLPFGCL